jgi:single-stranded-DNA-specific exonuclease
VARELLDENQLTRTIETDGSLDAAICICPLPKNWPPKCGGRASVPYFHDRFAVMSQRVVGDKHLKLRIAKQGQEFDAMLFNQVDWLPDNINAVYQLVANEWQGRKELQIYLQHWAAAD